MASNQVIDTEEWSPLAPSSAAAAIGWKNEAQNPKQETPPSNGIRKRPRSDMTPVAHQPVYGPQMSNGHLNEQEDASADTLEQEKATLSLPDGLSVDVDGAATLTFTKQPLHVCLLGRARIKVMNGDIEILGHCLDENTEAVEIESPAWTSAITINAQKIDTIVTVTSIRQQGTEQTFQILNPLQDSVRPTMIPSSWKIALGAVLEDLLKTKLTDESNKDENERTETRNARSVVCGAKHVGKSTCIRYAVNRLLSSSSFPAVALLDCDAGQPEMSPPGMLTLTIITKPLLSPPHHHMVMGEGSFINEHHAEACFYGHTTSKADPSLFLQCLNKLLESYVRLVADKHGGDESKLPLLINTDGWVKGMGFEILSAALDRIQPNHVIQLVGEVRSKVFDLSQVLKDEATTLHEAHSYRNSSVTHESSISVAPVAAIQSAMYRSLRLCTYFLGSPLIWDRIEFGQQGIEDYDCEIGTTLASMKPFVVPMDSIQYGTIRGVDKISDLGSENVILDALNASVVGLCRNEICDPGPGAKDTSCLSCVGLGLIRSIDRDRRLFYILTPVPFATLQSVNVIVGGSIQVPTECLFRGIHSDSFPYMSCDRVSVGIGGEFMKSRNSLMRKSSSL